MRGKREHRHAFAMRIVETLNKVNVAWAATSRAYGQPPGEPGLCGGKSGGFLVVNVGPFYSHGTTYGIHLRVEVVAH